MQESSVSANRNVIILALVIGIVLICCCSLVAMAFLAGRFGLRTAQEFSQLGSYTSTRAFAKSFAVTSPARLVVDATLGDVDIMVGDEGNAIDIQAEITAFGFTEANAQEYVEQVRIEASQSGQEVRLTVQVAEPPGGWRARAPEIHVRIAVPEETSLDLDAGVGDLSVSGTVGNIDIQANVGRVVVANVQTPEHLTIQTDVAAIEFEGPLTEGARYEMTSDVGAITVRLPADSSFQIDAASNLGDVAVDFEVVGEESREFVSKTVQGAVGGDSDTLLYLRSDVGAIYVRQQ